MILSTLYILFKGDTKDLKKNTKTAQADVDGLTKSLKAADKSTETLGSSFNKIITSGRSALLSVFSAAALVTGIKLAADYAEQLGSVADALDVNVGDFDAWGRAIEQGGGKASDFQASIKGIARQLGITGQEVLNFIPNFADQLKALPKVEALAVGKAFGLSEENTLALARGKAALDEAVERSKRFGVVTDENKEKAVAFNNALKDTQQIAGTLFRDVGDVVLPAATTGLNKVNNVGSFLHENKEFFAGIVRSLGSIVANPIPGIETKDIPDKIAKLSDSLKENSVFYSNFSRDLVGALGDVKEAASKLSESFYNFANNNGLLQPLDEQSDFVLKSRKNPAAFTDALYPKSVLSAAGSSSILNQKSSSVAVDIGEINVQTQATDAEGIAAAIESPLKTMISQVINNFDDSRLA